MMFKTLNITLICLLFLQVSCLAKKSGDESQVIVPPSETIQLPDLVWLQQEQSPSYYQCLNLTLDTNGNLYCSGMVVTSAPNKGVFDAFIKKILPDGSTGWIYEFGSNGVDACEDLVVDSSENLYCAGRTEGLLGDNHFGGADGFIIKFNSSGVQQWVEQFGTIGTDECKGIALDNNQNVYCAGRTNGNLAAATPTGMNGFVIKFNSSGVQQWVKQVEVLNSEILGIAVDSDGNVYSGGSRFVIRLDPSNGDQIWINNFYSPSTSCRAITVDSSKNVFCAGGAYDELDEPIAGGEDAFVMKINPADGDILWVTQLGESTSIPGFNADKTQYETCLAVTTDQSGNIYCVGETDGSLGSENAGDYDVFLMKIKPDGKIAWLTQTGSNDWDISYGVMVDDEGNIYWLGEAAGDLGLEYDGDAGPFIMKLKI